MGGYKLKWIISDKDDIKEAIIDILQKPYMDNVEQWNKVCHECNSVVVKDYIQHIDELFKRTIKKQNRNKAKIQFMNIHYLRSSYLDDSFSLVINLYSARYYFDPIETEISWCPKPLKEYMQKDMDLLDKSIIRKNILISPLELQKIKMQHYFDYLVLVPELLSVAQEKIKQLDSYQKLQREDIFLTQYGEYMGPMMQIDVEGMHK